MPSKRLFLFLSLVVLGMLSLVGQALAQRVIAATHTHAHAHKHLSSKAHKSSCATRNRKGRKKLAPRNCGPIGKKASTTKKAPVKGRTLAKPPAKFGATATKTTTPTATAAPTVTTAKTTPSVPAATATTTSATSLIDATGGSSASASSSQAMSSGWVSLGEPGVGGRITGLAVSPVDPNRILVGGDMLGVGLSQDGGKTWEATTGFSSWEINAFTWSTTNPTEVWVGTLSGPYESLDGGHTWTSQRVGMPTGDYPYSAPVQKVLIDSTNPSHLIAVGGNQRQFVKPGTGALNFGLVYESTNGGANWSTIANLGTNWNITDLVGSANLQTLYASVVGRGMYTSTDGGNTWKAVNTGLPNMQAIALTIDPKNSNTVWAAIAHSSTAVGGMYQPGGIYETTNGGQSWSAAGTGLPQNAESVATSATSMVSILRAGDGTLYTADQGYASQQRFESTNGGATWTQAGGTVAKFFAGEATPFAWASSADGTEVIGGTETLIASTDHRATWQDIGDTKSATGGWSGNGYSGLLGTRVAFNPSTAGDMYLTGFDGGNLLHSANAGASWTHPNSGYDNYDGGYDVSVGGSAGNDVYAVLGQAGAFNGIAVSKNAGQTFTTSVGGTLPARYSTGSGQGSVAVYSANGATAYAVLPNTDLYMTTNSGSTWTQVPLSSPAYALAASPTHHYLYVSTSAGVYEISNQGPPVLTAGSPTGLRRLIVAGGAVYGAGPLNKGAQSGLWSTRSGSWARIATNLFVNDIAIDPTNPNHIVYVTTDNPYHTTSSATGVWVSCDGGQTFSHYNNGLPMLRVLSVAFDPWNPRRVVIGTDGRGSWQTQLPSCS